MTCRRQHHQPPAAWGPLLGRRDLLRAGALGVAAGLLPFGGPVLRAAPAGKARSVILLWMAGGVTHLDSFDPKPDTPEEVRGTLGTIATGLPGVRFTEVMPGLARLTHLFALLRCFHHDSDDHFVSQAYCMSGRKVSRNQILTEPNVGAVVSHLLGPRAGFPGYIAVPGTTRPGPPPTNLFTGGWLGRGCAPFSTGGRPRNDDFTAGVPEPDEDQFHRQGLDYPPGVDAVRLRGRWSLRERLEAGLRRLEEGGDALAAQYRGAYAMLSSPNVRRAFELAREPDAVRERYGRTKIGTRCLLARRLVEAGARFVMVDYGYDPEYGNLWDNHAVPIQKQPHISEMARRPYHLAGMDRAFAALLADLDARGLLHETLVVFLTEFGRTPKINANGGRDHWGAAGSLFFAGGGVRGGQVLGATDRTAAQPTGPRYGPWDVAATVYAALGIDSQALLYDRQGRPLPVLPEGEVIPGLL